MLTILRTRIFAAWLDRLADPAGRARVARRLSQLNLQGHLGDWKPVGDGVAELRIDSGPGYRIYFMRHGSSVVLLLMGGDKSSQRRDIKRAVALAEAVRSRGIDDVT